MAQVQDALWAKRNAVKFRKYCGDCQVGGVSDTISLVLALILLVQVRAYQGADTFLAFADLRWAFDVAIHSGMKVNAFLAGVVGTDWLLLHDILNTDRQYVDVAGVASLISVLGCGTAQGRRFSVDIFNGLLKWLADEVWATIPGGTKSVLPSFYRQALNQSNAAVRPQTSCTMSIDWCKVSAAACEILVVSGNDKAPWVRTVAKAVGVLNRFAYLTERVAILESLGSQGFDVAQYVDDTTVPCASSLAAGMVVSKDSLSACSRYCEKVRASLNRKPGKTAVMPMLESELADPETIGSDVVYSYCILGILVDSALSFAPLLKKSLAIGWSSF